MSSLTRFFQDDIELYIDTVTGESFASQAGYSRMSKVAYDTIKKRVERVNTGDISKFKKAEVLTQQGLRLVTLLPADLVFDWLLKDNIELARAMGKAGATVYMHQIAGFKVSSTATEQPPTPKTVPSLPPSDIRVSNLIGCLEKIGLEIKNPRFNQSLQDLVGDILGLGQTKILSSDISVPVDRWEGVAERAEELGYSVSLVTQFRSQLGKYVKASGLSCSQEKRLCNGTQRLINLYIVSEKLDILIREFMDAKVLAH